MMVSGIARAAAGPSTMGGGGLTASFFVGVVEWAGWLASCEAYLSTYLSTYLHH